MRSLVYHQAAGDLCTLKRDDMQKRAIFSLFLMISTTHRAVMICHYSVMDKKSRIILIRLFCLRAIKRYFRLFLFGFELSRSNIPKVCIPSMQKNIFTMDLKHRFFYKALLKCCHNIIKIFYVSYENCNYRITVARAIRYAVGMIYIVSI